MWHHLSHLKSYFFFPLKVITNLVVVSHRFYPDANFLLLVLFWSDFLFLQLTSGISNLQLLKSSWTQSLYPVSPTQGTGLGRSQVEGHFPGSVAPSTEISRLAGAVAAIIQAMPSWSIWWSIRKQ